VSAAPGTVVARENASGEADMPAAAAAAAAAPMPASAAATAPAGAPGVAGATLDRDELYQDFMRRLRRDVLEQREQLGELF
jgi:hypothetical protein